VINLQVLLIGAHLTPREKPPENPSNMCSIRRSIELFGGKTAVAFGISFYIVFCAVLFFLASSAFCPIGKYIHVYGVCRKG